MEKNKLTIEDKMKIALTNDKSLRELAEEYNVHHSTIDEIKRDSIKMLKNHWEEKSKRIGRPSKKEEIDEEKEELKEKIRVIERKIALKSMNNDWLRLQLGFLNERLEEAKVHKHKQLKKKRKTGS